MHKQVLTTIIAVLVLCTNCTFEAKVKKEIHRSTLDSTSEYYDQQYKTYIHEGCEYIVVNYGSASWGTHKGNCKNPIHKIKTN